MPKKRKVPFVGEFDFARARLWEWLVVHGYVQTDGIEGDRDAIRRSELQRIRSEGVRSQDPAKKRAAAVAGALLDLDLAATERETAKWYLEFRADTAGKAKTAEQAVAGLRKSWRDLLARANADRKDIPPMAARALQPLKLGYWPEEIATILAARETGLICALALIADYRFAVETVGNQVWGSETRPDVIKSIDSAALLLDMEGSFSAPDIADLLDERNESRSLKANRMWKRIQRAKKAIARTKRPGPPMSKQTAAEPSQTAPYAARRKRSPKNRAGRRRPSRAH